MSCVRDVLHACVTCFISCHACVTAALQVQRWDMIALCFVRLEQWQELRLLAETKVPDTSRELLSTIGE